jgi:hypothetical protein
LPDGQCQLYEYVFAPADPGPGGFAGSTLNGTFILSIY